MIDVPREEIEDDSLDAAISAARAAVRETVRHGESLDWERFTKIVREAAADFKH